MAKKPSRPGMGIDVDDDHPDRAEPVPVAADGPPAQSAEEGQKPRQDRRPICTDHHVQMVAYATSAMFTYYKCPVDGCRQKDKQIRPIGPLKKLCGG